MTYMYRDHHLAMCQHPLLAKITSILASIYFSFYNHSNAISIAQEACLVPSTNAFHFESFRKRSSFGGRGKLEQYRKLSDGV